MDDINFILTKAFGLKPKHIIKQKSYFIWNTEAGFFKLRKTTNKTDHIIFQHDLIENLYKQDFKNIERFKLSKNNLPFVQLGESTYILTDYNDYKEIDFSDIEEFKLSITNISKLHNNTQNIKFNSKIFYGTSNLILDYEKIFYELSLIKKKVSAQNKWSDFDVYFIKNYENYKEQIFSSINLLKKTNLQEQIFFAKQKNIICHSLLKEENICINNNNIYFSNFCDCKINPHIFDLAYVIRRYIKCGNIDSLSINEIINIYSRNRNFLNQNDLDILYPILNFPNDFVKLCSEYYSKKRSWAPNALIKKMDDIIFIRDSYDKYIHDVKKI